MVRAAGRIRGEAPNRSPGVASPSREIGSEVHLTGPGTRQDTGRAGRGRIAPMSTPSELSSTPFLPPPSAGAAIPPTGGFALGRLPPARRVLSRQADSMIEL